MRLVFAGTPDVALPALEALIGSKHDVVAVVTRPDAQAGRGRNLVSSPVAHRAESEGIEVLKPTKPKDAYFVDRLRAIAPDCCPVVAYGALLPQHILDIPTHGWVNLHFSVLPAWRGAAPVQRSLLAGDEVTGATTFRLVRDMDAGPYFGFFTETIRATDTAGDLLGRLAWHGAGLLVDTLDHIEAGDIEAREQDEQGLSFAPKIDVDDARVRWDEPAHAVDRRIRACTPEPGAWTTVAGERLKLGPVGAARDVTGLTPGEVSIGKQHVHVGTATHAVALADVGPQGKTLMHAADWARGLRIEGAVRLGD